MGCGGQKYFLLLVGLQLQKKEPWYPISILGFILKSEAPLELYTLKVLARYNGLELV